MRTPALVSLALTVLLAAAATCPAAPQLVLSDPNLPLWEMRPMDRHVYVLTLEGDWKTKPQWDAEYSVNIEFPDGAVVEHRPVVERFFRKGEVQVLLIEYQYEKHHFQKDDRLTVFISKRLPGGGPDDRETISNPLEVAWPFDRDVVRLPPKTRFSEPTPIDTYFPPGQEPAPPPKPSRSPPAEEPVKKPTPPPPPEK